MMMKKSIKKKKTANSNFRAKKELNFNKITMEGKQYAKHVRVQC